MTICLAKWKNNNFENHSHNWMITILKRVFVERESDQGCANAIHTERGRQKKIKSKCTDDTFMRDTERKKKVYSKWMPFRRFATKHIL